MKNTIKLILILLISIVLITNIPLYSNAFSFSELLDSVKESMVPWMIGILVSFGAYGIWRITMGIFYGFV